MGPTSTWVEPTATGIASLLFFFHAVLTLLVIKDIRRRPGAGRSKSVAWLVVTSWLTLMASTVLFCSALMQVPEQVCRLRMRKGESCELV